jgi:hypothetical protein
MHLQRRGACADHLSSLAPGVARGAGRVEPPFRCREGRIAGQGPLARGLPRGIDIKDEVATPLPINDAANRFGGPARGLAGLLEEGPKGFDTRTIGIGQEATQARSMRQAFAPKQGHESWSEGRQALKEVSERPFSTDRIADQQREEINGFIAAEPATYQTDLLCQGF